MRRKTLTETYVADSSVVIKWFKRGEAYEKESLMLLGDVLDGKLTLILSEWTLLEVARGLKKSNYSAEKIDKALYFLEELLNDGFIKVVPVSPYIAEAKDIIKELNLYASDAIHLAIAVKERLTLISEDTHLLAEKVTHYSEKFSIRVMRLQALYDVTR
jgi:predicted nucleic acid-binding protein